MTDYALQQWTQEQVERLARDFMGWKRGDELVDFPPHYHGLEGRWFRETDVGPSLAGGARWNPLFDAAEDYQVLQRARETWGRTDRLSIAAFACAVVDLCSANLYPAGWFPDDGPTIPACVGYTVGDYARAVLAVLDSQATDR